MQERLNPDLEIDGILATMYDRRTVAQPRGAAAAWSRRSSDKVFQTVITRTVRFPETTVAGEPITTFATSSGGA